MNYLHRNGETAPPTEPGWYWFSGYFGGYLDDNHHRGLVSVTRSSATDDLVVWPTWGDGWEEMGTLQGCWWGPLTPPWEQEPPA